VLSVAVCYLALIPAPPPQLSVGWDKGNHLLAFATLACLGDLGFCGTVSRRIAGAAVLFLYGVGIEIAQHLVPARSSEWGDLLADLAGIAIGIFVSSVVKGRGTA
jgi:VanZ family protein